MDPVITYYDNNDVAISSGNPVAFGLIEKGVASNPVKIWVWNDRNLVGADPAINPMLHAISGPDDMSIIFSGTAWNGFTSMLEARSCGAYNATADRQCDWTKIGPASFLAMGSIVAGAAREIELRINVPADAQNMSLSLGAIRVQY